MTILDSVAGGTVLEKPRHTGTRCPDTYDELRQRIWTGLLPKQQDFCTDHGHKIIGYVAGFGAGKTRAACAAAVLDAMDNPNTVGAVFEPTHILLKDVWVRSFDQFLDEHAIEFDYRSTPQPEYVLHLPAGPVTLLCRATETWNRVRGQNLSFVIVDEFDTSPVEVAKKALEMMLARLRGGQKPRLRICTTPEGYRITHQIFVQDFQNAEQDEHDTGRLDRLRSERRLVQASTLENPHLPDGFVDTLYENYPPQLVVSYIQGQFTNLEQTTVYSYFDRDRHWSQEEVTDDDRIFVGCDLNVGNCMLEVLVRRKDTFHFVDEIVTRDTPGVVTALRERYPDHYERGDIVVIPDAASRQRTTTNAKESDLSILKRGGFAIKERLSNPAIEDRINAMNVLLMTNRILVSSRCKYLTRSLEQQAYDRNGKPEKGGTGLDDPSHPVDAAGYAIYYLAPLNRYATGGSRFRLW